MRVKEKKGNAPAARVHPPGVARPTLRFRCAATRGAWRTYHLAPYGCHPTQRSAAWHAWAISGRGSCVDSPTLVALGITHREEVVPGPAVRKPERAHRPDRDIE